MELYTPSEVAAMLKVSEDSVIRLFADRPGVVNLGQPESIRPRRRRYRILRIPRAVLNRFLLENQVR